MEGLQSPLENFYWLREQFFFFEFSGFGNGLRFSPKIENFSYVVTPTPASQFWIDIDQYERIISYAIKNRRRKENTSAAKSTILDIYDASHKLSYIHILRHTVVRVFCFWAYVCIMEKEARLIPSSFGWSPQNYILSRFCRLSSVSRCNEGFFIQIMCRIYCLDESLHKLFVWCKDEPFEIVDIRSKFK